MLFSPLFITLKMHYIPEDLSIMNSIDEIIRNQDLQMDLNLLVSLFTSVVNFLVKALTVFSF